MSVAGGFTVRCERRADAVVVVARGEIDLSTAPTLYAALQGPEAQAPNVVLDLRKVTFLDSTGLSVIAEEHARSLESGRRFAIAVRGAAAVQRILDLSGLGEALDVVADPEERIAEDPPRSASEGGAGSLS